MLGFIRIDKENASKCVSDFLAAWNSPDFRRRLQAEGELLFAQVLAHRHRTCFVAVARLRQVFDSNALFLGQGSTSWHRVSLLGVASNP